MRLLKWITSIVTAAVLGSGSVLAQAVCTQPITLRATPCSSGTTSCVNKGSQINFMEEDHNILDVKALCDATASGVAGTGTCLTNQWVHGINNGSGPTCTQPTFSNLSGSATPSQLPVFVASGGSHAAGIVPDPGATASVIRFLREDATFDPALPFTVDGLNRWNTTIGGIGIWNITGAIFATNNGSGGFQFRDTTGDGILFRSNGGGIDFADGGNGMQFNALPGAGDPSTTGSDIELEGNYIQIETRLGAASTAPNDRHIWVKSGTGPILIDASSGAGSITMNAGSGGINMNEVPTLPSQSPSLFFASPASGSGVPSFRLPNLLDPIVILQASSPGIAQTGNENITGAMLSGSVTTGPVASSGTADPLVNINGTTGVSTSQHELALLHQGFTGLSFEVYNAPTDGTQFSSLGPNPNITGAYINVGGNVNGPGQDSGLVVYTENFTGSPGGFQSGLNAFKVPLELDSTSHWIDLDAPVGTYAENRTSGAHGPSLLAAPPNDQTTPSNTQEWVTTHVDLSSLTRSSTTASATSASPHGLVTGDLAHIMWANEAAYDGTFSVTVTDSTHFTFTVAGSPTTPATANPRDGSITVAKVTAWVDPINGVQHQDPIGAGAITYESDYKGKVRTWIAVQDTASGQISGFNIGDPTAPTSHNDEASFSCDGLVANGCWVGVDKAGAGLDFYTGGGSFFLSSTGTLDFSPITGFTWPANFHYAGSASSAGPATTALAWNTARTLAGNSVDGSANVPFTNGFIVKGTADAGLTGAQFLGALGTGILKNTTTTGVLSIATAPDFPTLNQSTTGNAATSSDGLSSASGTVPLTLTLAAKALTGSVVTATTSTTGVVQLETNSSDTTGGASHVVTSSDTRLSDSRAPNGTASGDLSGSYPSPNVAKINGTSLAGLATGIVKNTTSTGVPSIAVAADIPEATATTTTLGVVQLETNSSDTTGGASHVVTSSDTRLSNSRAPNGTAGGDLSGSYPNPGVANVNGVAYPATPSTDSVPVITASNTATYKVIPDCTDTTGNHLNYTASTHAFSCGTSSSGGGGGLTNPLAAGTVSANSLQVVQAGTGIYQPATNVLGLSANGIDALRLHTITSGVNYFDMTPSASSGDIKLIAAGTATNLSIEITPKGSGLMIFPGNGIEFDGGGGTVISRSGAAAAIGTNSPAIFGGDGSTNSGVFLANNAGLVTWGSGNPSVGVGDTTLTRGAAKVVSVDTTTKGDHLGWFNYGGTSRVAADVTNATATMSNMTGLSSTLQASRFYILHMVIKGINSSATEGVQFDFNGGTATMTDFWVGCGIQASGGTDVIGTSIVTSLAGTIQFTTFTGESVIVCDGSMTVNGAGTLIPRVAEVSHTAGTVTVRKGSNMVLTDTP